MTEQAMMDVDLSRPDEMVLIRIFDAPRDLVWQCWTDPEHLAVWWGPEGMINTVTQDFRPGGHQQITMRDADGNAYPMQMQILDIVDGEKLVGRIGGEGHANEEIISGITITVTFEALGATRTRLTVRQSFPSQVERDANMEMGAREGWGQSFVKLGKLLERLA